MIIKIIFSLLSIASGYISIKLSYFLIRDYKIAKAFGTINNFKRMVLTPLVMLSFSIAVTLLSLLVVLFN